MIKDIEKILETNIPNNFKEELIFQIIAKNKNAIPIILGLLNKERAEKDELILEMNIQLSRTHIYAAMNSKKNNNKGFSLQFINQEIKKFYETYANYVSHCFYGTKKGDKLLSSMNSNCEKMKKLKNV